MMAPSTDSRTRGGRGLTRRARAVYATVGLAKRVWRRSCIFLFDAAFLSYLFVMGSYVVTSIASGVGRYIPVPGGFVVLLAVAAAAAWGSVGTSVGRKLVDFFSGKLTPVRDGELRKRSVSLPAGDRALVGAPVMGQLRARPTRAPTLSGAPPRASWYRTLWGWSIAVALIVTLAAATVITRFDFSQMVANWPFASRLLAHLFQPNWSITGDVIRLTLESIFMALIATLLAVPIAAALSFFAARNLRHGIAGGPAYVVIRATASIVRSIEPIIWCIVFQIWVRPGPFPGALALFVCSIVDLTKLYSEQLESIDPGPMEAITAVGGRRSQVLVHGVVPQIINPYLSFTLYRWDINLRMGTVIGMVGGGGIGSLLNQYMHNLHFEEVAVCLLAIIIVVWSIDTLSARLRARLA